MLGKEIHGHALRFFSGAMTQKTRDIFTDQVGFNINLIADLALLQGRQRQSDAG